MHRCERAAAAAVVVYLLPVLRWRGTSAYKADVPFLLFKSDRNGY